MNDYSNQRENVEDFIASNVTEGVSVSGCAERGYLSDSLIMFSYLYQERLSPICS